MKQVIFLAGLCVVLAAGACSPKLTSGSGDTDGKTHSVYYGTILFTDSYCGGARPTEAIVQHHATPRPFAGDTLIFQNVSSGKEFKVLTDEHGHYEVELPAGNYVLHPKVRTGQTGYSPNYDPNCERWRNLELYRLDQVTGSGVHLLDFTVHFPCDPCETLRRP